MIASTSFRAALVAALVALPMGAVAQSDEADSGATDLPVGRPVQDTGSTYVAETHGDWEIRCVRAPEGQVEPCQLYQLLVDETGNPVAEMNVFDLPDQGGIAAGATIITPLETLLQPGLRLRIDDGQWVEYPFAFCQPVGCFVRLGLRPQDLESYRGGDTVNIAIVPLPAPDQVVQVSASLSGFTAGFTALANRMGTNETGEGMFDSFLEEE